MLLRVARAGSAALLLVLVTLAAAAPTVTASSHTFSWHAPADATGAGAFRALIDVGTDNECTATLEATAGAAEGPLVFLGFGDSWGMMSSGHLVQVHSEGLGVDTRNEPSGASGLRFTFEDWAVSGTLEFTVLNVAMDGWLAKGADPWYPARIDVACDDDITVLGFSGSREVGSFADDTMSGGDGASANALFARATLNMEDTYERSFSTSTVEVDLIEFGTSVMDWHLHAPSGLVGGEGLGPGGDMHYEDGPGTYTFTMDRVGEGYLWAWFAGFDPVADLDDLFA